MKVMVMASQRLSRWKWMFFPPALLLFAEYSATIFPTSAKHINVCGQGQESSLTYLFRGVLDMCQPHHSHAEFLSFKQMSKGFLY